MPDISGVIIGGILALAGSFGAKFYDERAQRRSLRASIRAEIAVIIRGAEARGHERLFRNYVEHWNKTNQELPITLWGFDAVTENPILSANLGKIGALGADVAEDVVMFYGLINAITIDLKALKNGQLAVLTPQQRVEVVKKSLAMWDDAKAIGDRLHQNL